MIQVNLGSSDFVVSVLFVEHSVLVEPVVNLSSGVKVISEVGGSAGSDPELGLLHEVASAYELLVLSLVVF